jgi:hypothetical protein
LRRFIVPTPGPPTRPARGLNRVNIVLHGPNSFAYENHIHCMKNYKHLTRQVFIKLAKNEKLFQKNLKRTSPSLKKAQR